MDRDATPPLATIGTAASRAKKPLKINELRQADIQRSRGETGSHEIGNRQRGRERAIQKEVAGCSGIRTDPEVRQRCAGGAALSKRDRVVVVGRTSGNGPLRRRTGDGDADVIRIRCLGRSLGRGVRQRAGRQGDVKHPCRGRTTQTGGVTYIGVIRIFKDQAQQTIFEDVRSAHEKYPIKTSGYLYQPECYLYVNVASGYTATCT